MLFNKSVRTGLAICGVALAVYGLARLAPAVSATQSFPDDIVTYLGTFGGVESRAFGINATGRVVGYASRQDGRFHAFLWDGTLRDLGTLPNANESFAYAINDAGQIVGAAGNLGSITPRAFLWQNGALTELGAFTPRALNRSGDVAGALPVKRNGLEWFEHACLWRNGTLTDLGTLGGSNSYAYAINDAGQVAGFSFTADDQRTRAFLWSNGARADLGALGGNGSQALALNNAHQVCGVGDTSTSAAGGAPHAFLFTLDATGAVSNRVDLGALGGKYSYAQAVNSRGQVVGTNGHAVLWQNGAAYDLNALLPADAGWVLQNATAINESGQIVGWGTLLGFTSAFLLRRISNTVTASVSAASYNGARLAPASIVATFGVNLAATTQTASTSNLPSVLAGTQVLVRDSAGRARLAPLFFVSPNQVNYQIPPDTAPGAATILVSNS